MKHAQNKQKMTHMCKNLQLILLVSLLARASNLHAVEPSSGAPIEFDPVGCLNLRGPQNFKGIAVPFGMVKLGPQHADGGDRPRLTLGRNYMSGFFHTSAIAMVWGHGNEYRNLAVLPMAGSLEVDRKMRVQDYAIRAGDYASILQGDVGGTTFALTTARRSAFHRYTPANTGPFHLVIDASHQINGGPREGELKWHLGTSVAVEPDGTVTGCTRFAGGWGGSGECRLYFALVVDRKPDQIGTWRHEIASGAEKPWPTGTYAPLELKPGNTKEEDKGVEFPKGLLSRHYQGATINGQKLPRYRDFLRCGADVGATLSWQSWPKDAVLNLRVGLSHRSAAQALANLRQEMPDTDFAAAAARARTQWTEVLSTITVEGSDPQVLSAFYMLYRNVVLSPTDKTGEHPDPAENGIYYDDFCTLWDTYRSKFPLLAWALPQRHGAIAQGMLTAIRHEGGFIFDSHIQNTPTRTQGGCNGEIVLADAIMKGSPGVDAETVYKHLLFNATTPSPVPGSHGRQAKATIPAVLDLAGPINTHLLENLPANWAISQVAGRLGKKEDQERFQAAALMWTKWFSLKKDHRNTVMFAQDDDYQGFIPGDFYEGGVPVYSYYVPHDAGGLVKAMGGPEKMIRRMQKDFGQGKGPSNEMLMFPQHLYHWCGRPDLTMATMRKIIGHRPPSPGDEKRKSNLFSGRWNGDEDDGAQSSWYLWQSIGLYPVDGTDLYLIVSPIHPKVTFQRNGKPFVLEAKNAAPENLYVQSAELNGKPLSRAWLRYDEISQGGRLTVTMGPEPSTWGRTETPPSASDGRQQP